MAHMYETYVPIPEPIEERKPPTIADIVRQKTDGGAMIIDFFTDVMTGRVDDARLCHRIDAAKQLVKYGHKGAADFIADHGDEPCDHCESRKRGPRSPKESYPTPGVLHARAITYDFLNLLTEDFLTVLSAVDEDLMVMLVRAQTAHGETVVEFLNSVMSNRVEGFKAHHRIAAARELISHIIRDEQRSHTPCPSTPVGAGFKPALPGTARQPGNLLSLVPTEAGGEPAPAKAGVSTQNGTHPVRPEPVEGQCSANADHTPVVPAQPEAKIVRPEPVEEPALSLPKGQCSADPANTKPTTTVVPAQAGTQGGGGVPANPAETAHTQHSRPVVPAQPEAKIVRPEPVLSTVEGPVEGQCSAETANTDHTAVVPAQAGRSPPG